VDPKNTELIVRGVLDRLRSEEVLLGIPFNVEINNAVPVSDIGWEYKSSILYLGADGINILDRNQGLCSPLVRIEGDSIIHYPVTLFRTRTTTEHIKTLKITSEKQDNIDFLNKLIIPEKSWQLSKISLEAH
jgi:hypothetical protein